MVNFFESACVNKGRFLKAWLLNCLVVGSCGGLNKSGGIHLTVLLRAFSWWTSSELHLLDEFWVCQLLIFYITVPRKRFKYPK